MQAEQSFNRKLMRVRVQRKQVVFKTLAPFFIQLIVQSNL